MQGEGDPAIAVRIAVPPEMTVMPGENEIEPPLICGAATVKLARVGRASPRVGAGNSHGKISR